MNSQNTIIAIIATLSASLALAEDFKTVNGKEYKNATISRVEPDGLVLKTKSGISKVYFVELPQDVQERFHYGSATRTGTAVTQRIDKAESAKHAAASDEAESAFLEAESAKRAALGDAADKFAQKVTEKLQERESILQGKHTPGPAEKMILREFAFNKAFLAGTAIIASLLFAIVWRRFK